MDVLGSQNFGGQFSRIKPHGHLFCEHLVKIRPAIAEQSHQKKKGKTTERLAVLHFSFDVVVPHENWSTKILDRHRLCTRNNDNN